jgi:trehalose 6-phosphate synthase
MKRALRFVVILVIGLLTCSALAHVAMTREARRWFENDLRLRGELVLGMVRKDLVENWGQTSTLTSKLTHLARAERIMAAEACAPDGKTLVASAGFPRYFSCDSVRGRLAGARNGRIAEPADFPGGRVYLSVLPIDASDPSRGHLVLLQDMSYVDRREQRAQQMLWLWFGAFALGASLVTLFAVWLSWQSWAQALRRFIKGDQVDPEFQPIAADARELVQRLSLEWDQERRDGRWTPERLKATLNHHLHGERIVIMANREPYIHERGEGGKIIVRHPASGLVTALEPVMRACSGTWVAHGSGSADRDTVDGHDRVKVPPGEESYSLRRVWLSEAEENGYYYGFSNEGMWPLCHLAHARPEFRAEDWQHYRLVNQRFADAVVREVDVDDPIVLVQDYHFALAPRMIRELLPKATVLTFWHIPWPNAERFGICPWREEILHGLLGSSILGFHTQQHCNNFFDSVDTYLEARIDRAEHAVVRKRQSTIVRPYPISIEWPVRLLDHFPTVAECRASVLEELGLPSGVLLGVGVDRLDYTKGIEERLLAVERALERFPDLRGRFVFVQLAAPSRTRIPRYQQLADAVEHVAARVNERFGAPGYKPIVLARKHHEQPDVFRYYRAADLCYVSSLHDGMNLVAKEFVAAREDERGVLVLSHFTGAARELPEALIVNPYDLEEASAALRAALTMSEAEQRSRMRSMRSLVSELNIYRWAGRMLVDAAQLRKRERVLDKLPYHWPLPSFARS